MDFSALQQSWQAQAAPPAGSLSHTATLLAETQRLHQFGRRRNRLATILLLLALSSFAASGLLTAGPLPPRQWWGLGLIALTLLGFIGAMWWGTALRRAVQPDATSQAYLQASLRIFQFRRGVLLWLAVPYALLLSVGLLLLHWPRFHISGAADWWKAALWVAVFVGGALLGRRVGLRRYEREFGAAERTLQQWQLAWAGSTADTR